MIRTLTLAILATTLLTAVPARAQTPEAAARTAFNDDVHASIGLTCTACHTGQVSPSAPERTQIAPMCAKCHSDAAYMRQFDPQVRVDQLAQYVTSVHGQRMAKGQERVATCSDCHGAHGVKRVRDSRAPVAPLNVAQTCARCHADASRMKPFGRDATPPADWSASIHATALLKRGDSSAPTCSTCHGSHGAVPPGVNQVANVCAQCHVREADLFKASPKKAIFEAIGQAECLVCHSNHRIEAPQDAWLGIKEGAVCATCHDSSTNGSDAILHVRQQLDTLSTAMASADAVLARAERAGMLVDEGRAAFQEAHEQQINARVMIHAFAAAPFNEVAARGLTAARTAETSGNQAMQELQYRRRGLGVATILILGFLVTLWFKIRSLPTK